MKNRHYKNTGYVFNKLKIEQEKLIQKLKRRSMETRVLESRPK
jgi:hypothetical protein